MRQRVARCNVTRCYKPLELREVIGKVTINEVRERFDASSARAASAMSAELFHPTGAAHDLPPALGVGRSGGTNRKKGRRRLVEVA
ncbi:hypothetical protein MesoLj131c_71090 (plasmid) [Mesorhizobium sp. 131-3-5]|nr:hypothetical protein MesoLj131c_71090 [Mesorhizobium sp. 131-3-5]